tara:strand:+ start:48 stop:500 length:453 start_codon:yes stop_codon:yes gene_type:complete
MLMERKPIIILMADDDDDDYQLTRDAFEEHRIASLLYRVRDGEELMDYLLRRDRYKYPEQSPRPDLILLDLNMPKKDGREALAEIKKHPDLKKIPVVILTVSELDDDIDRAYDLGASSYIKKPEKFNQLVDVVKVLKRYWLEIVQLPISE